MNEFLEEFLDFFEDLGEIVFRKKPKKVRKPREITLYGTIVKVKPAYVFADRIENSLKTIFGFSILVSAIIASFWGLTGLSELLDILIKSILGRVIMLVIGFSYFIIGVWKIAHLKK